MKLKYPIETNTLTQAKACGKELKVSPKHSRELAVAIENKRVSKAKDFLRSVLTGKKPIPFRRYNKNVPHRSQLTKFVIGRFPKKATQAMLKLIREAEANAEVQGLDKDRLFIRNIFVTRGRYKRPYQIARACWRRGRNRTRSTNLQVVLEER
jgi:large subunit ribosomal protein L22